MAQLCIVDDVFRIDVVATAEESICPLCAEVATHVRSYYTRVVDDVPCAGHRVQLILHVRKFRCDTPTCPRKVFAERLGPFLEAWAHKTTRLRKAVEAIGLATCGEGLSRRSIPGRRRASSHCGFATSSNSRACRSVWEDAGGSDLSFFLSGMAAGLVRCTGRGRFVLVATQARRQDVSLACTRRVW